MSNPLKKVGHGIEEAAKDVAHGAEVVGKVVGHRSLDVAIDEDRAVAAATLGTPVDESISGASGNALSKGQQPLATLGDALDAVHFAGDPHHAQDAANEDNYVDAADQAYKDGHPWIPNPLDPDPNPKGQAARKIPK